MSWHGIQTVARLELRQRIRASRWAIVLGIWFAVIALVTVLSYWAMHDPQVDSGASMYDIVIFFVLGLGMLVVPSLTATSINGDREHGVLATLQTTLLTSADIVLGKLVAAWAIAGAFLATALPFLVWAWLEGGISLGRILLSLLVLLLVLAVVCAIGLMFSTLTARPVSSAVLTYLAMGVLVFGTVIGFGLTAFLVTQEETVSVYGIPDDWWEKNSSSVAPPPGTEPMEPVAPLEPTRADCTTFDRATVAHTERIWWMLPLNPFVVVADAAPSDLSPRRRCTPGSLRCGGSAPAPGRLAGRHRRDPAGVQHRHELPVTRPARGRGPARACVAVRAGLPARQRRGRHPHRHPAAAHAHPQAAQRHPHRLSRPRGIRPAPPAARSGLSRAAALPSQPRPRWCLAAAAVAAPAARAHAGTGRHACRLRRTKGLP